MQAPGHRNSPVEAAIGEDAFRCMPHPITPTAPPPSIQGALDVLMSIHKPGIGVLFNAAANHVEKILPLDKHGLIAPVAIAGVRHNCRLEACERHLFAPPRDRARKTETRP